MCYLTRTTHVLTTAYDSCLDTIGIVLYSDLMGRDNIGDIGALGGASGRGGRLGGANPTWRNEPISRGGRRGARVDGRPALGGTDPNKPANSTVPGIENHMRSISCLDAPVAHRLLVTAGMAIMHRCSFGGVRLATPVPAPDKNHLRRISGIDPRCPVLAMVAPVRHQGASFAAATN